MRDVYLAGDEQKTLYQLLNEGEIDRPTLDHRLKRAGRTLVLSLLTKTPRDIYERYKSRKMVEDHFAAFKSMIHAEKLNFRDTTIQPQPVAMCSSGSYAPISIDGS